MQTDSQIIRNPSAMKELRSHIRADLRSDSMIGDSVESLDAGAGRPSVHSRRTVYNLKPLKSASLAKKGVHYATQLLLEDDQPIVEATGKSPRLPHADLHDSVTTMPRPIPVPKAATVPALAMEENPSPFNKMGPAIPDKTTSFTIQQGPGSRAVPIPTGSWTTRQVRYPVDDPEKQPIKPKKPLQAIKVRKPIPAKINGSRNVASGEVIEDQTFKPWQFRFKRKWIKEELYKQKQNFPEDPDYDDDWDSALNFIEACGPQAALQAAFLETGNGESTLEEDILNDNLLFEDDTATTIPAPSPVQENCSIAVRAATLLRLHYQAAVV